MPRITPLDNYRPGYVPVGPAIRDRQRRQPDPNGGRIPLYAPNPNDEDWSGHREKSEPGTFEDKKNPDTPDDGTVIINFELRYAEALGRVMTETPEA